MRNTGTIYSSTERSPTVLPEMAELLPPLTGEQLAALEADILKNSCYSPVIVNEDMVIVDGHNRQRLCEQHGLPYQMAVFSFEDLLEAKQWALDTQKGRRNLDKWELGKIALRLKPDIEARARENMGTRTDLSATLPKGSEPVDTRRELADAVGLGERTMGKVMQIDEHAPAAVKEALDSGDLSINRGSCRRSSGTRPPPWRWSWKRRKRRSGSVTRRPTEGAESLICSAKPLKRPCC